MQIILTIGQTYMQNLIISILMPHTIVQAKEYECSRCEYKWINRRNGEERPQPKYCPSCKSSLWDTERINYSLCDKDTDRRMRLLKMTPGQRMMLRHNQWKDKHPEEWINNLALD